MMRYPDESRGAYYRRWARRTLNQLWFAPGFIATPLVGLWLSGAAWTDPFGRTTLVVLCGSIIAAVWSTTATLAQYREYQALATWHDQQEGHHAP